MEPAPTKRFAWSGAHPHRAPNGIADTHSVVFGQIPDMAQTRRRPRKGIARFRRAEVFALPCRVFSV